jgi:hypothetical protein
MKDCVLNKKPKPASNDTVWTFDRGHPLRLERGPENYFVPFLPCCSAVLWFCNRKSGQRGIMSLINFWHLTTDYADKTNQIHSNPRNQRFQKEDGLLSA